jgi:hypothetical protein
MLFPSRARFWEIADSPAAAADNLTGEIDNLAGEIDSLPIFGDSLPAAVNRFSKTAQ